MRDRRQQILNPFTRARDGSAKVSAVGRRLLKTSTNPPSSLKANEPTELLATSMRSFTLRLGKYSGRKERKKDERTDGRRGRCRFWLASLFTLALKTNLRFTFLEQIVHFCGSTAHELEELTTAEEKRDERARARAMIFLKPLWRIYLTSFFRGKAR